MKTTFLDSRLFSIVTDFNRSTQHSNPTCYWGLGHRGNLSDPGLGHCYRTKWMSLDGSALGMHFILGGYTVSMVMDLVGLLLLVFSICPTVSGSYVSTTLKQAGTPLQHRTSISSLPPSLKHLRWASEHFSPSTSSSSFFLVSPPVAEWLSDT